MKPIQATPVLSGRDAEQIIKQALAKPSQASIREHKRVLAKIKHAEKKQKAWVI